MIFSLLVPIYSTVQEMDSGQISEGKNPRIMKIQLADMGDFVMESSTAGQPNNRISMYKEAIGSVLRIWIGITMAKSGSDYAFVQKNVHKKVSHKH